ncbi:MAG TPA: cyclomaltodextrinase N-terminal domain-containing protein, partial [Methylibium sp.]
MIARLVTGIVLGLCALAAQAQVERIDPPSWWVGMKSRQLQLMVHGPHIADYQPELHYPGVRLSKVTRVESPNYLFVDLDIAPLAKPGRLSLDFRKGAERITVPYELLLRAPHSAERRGFGNADVILNLMPDRFANGNPANDDVPGFADQANRADNDAGRHGGDIQGIVDHLDHIAAMGYTMLWPTPLTESNQ